MPDLGKYAPEILTAYAATILLVLGLLLQTWLRARKLRRALEAAERRRQENG